MLSRDYGRYENILKELCALLKEHNEEQWFEYFTKSADLLNKGRPQKSISHTLGAYGGMCSFNDDTYFTGADFDVANKYIQLKEQLLKTCQENRSLIRRALEW